jgi:hypothetical protein
MHGMIAYILAMSDEAQDAASAPTGEPWGPRLWLLLALLVLVTASLDSYGISSWPLADDEVPSLVEMGLLHVDDSVFSVPEGQIGRLPLAMPVWYAVQRRALALLPANEMGFRIPSLICAILTSGLAFLLAARWRGLWYATALAIVVNASQMFVLLSQIDRFYSMPLMLLTLTLGAMWVPAGGVAMVVVTALLAALTVLSHNIVVAVFVLAFLASGAAYVVGRGDRRVLLRSGVAALVSVALYLLYLRPIIQGWSSTGNPTPVLVSFTAHAGVPALALALLGAWLSVSSWKLGAPMLWWALLFVGSLCFFPLAPVSWNPRYFVFFMPAMWVLAAYAMETIALGVGRRSAGAAWYACVVLLLLPSLLSHYQDGSRHDYRQAAAVLVSHVQDGQPILSDDAETISYYLPAGLRQTLKVRTKVRELPASEFFVVARSNAWMPLPEFPHRHSELLAEIYRRRFDQFSHILRVYRVTPADQ